MVSGIDPTPECATTYQEMKKEHKYGSIVFMIEHGKVCVEATGPPGQNFPDFVQLLCQSGEPRYGVHDYKFHHEKEGVGKTNMSRIVTVMWNPDASTSLPLKMVYSTSFENFKERVGLAAPYLQASDTEALAEEEVRKLVTAHMRK